MITGGSFIEDAILIQIKRGEDIYDIGIDIEDETKDFDLVKKCSQEYLNVKNVLESLLLKNKLKILQYQIFFDKVEKTNNLCGYFEDDSGLKYFFQICPGNQLFNLRVK